jgi:uncharacterized membrane protein YidH (DUF202 family)
LHHFYNNIIKGVVRNTPTLWCRYCLIFKPLFERRAKSSTKPMDGWATIIPNNSQTHHTIQRNFFLHYKMSDVDNELFELEKLITLQQRKLTLLREKSQHKMPINSSDLNNTAIDMDATHVNNAIHNIKQMEIGSSSDSINMMEDSFGRPTMSTLSPRSGRESMFRKNMDKLVEPVSRMTYLANELANERTLLAWIRTALSMIRTVFAFYAFKGINSFGDTTHRISLILVTLLAGGTFFQGFWRFSVVVGEILNIDPTRAPLGRPTIKPYMAGLSLLFIIVMVSVLYRGWWVKASTD